MHTHRCTLNRVVDAVCLAPHASLVATLRSHSMASHPLFKALIQATRINYRHGHTTVSFSPSPRMRRDWHRIACLHPVFDVGDSMGSNRPVQRARFRPCGFPARTALVARRSRDKRRALADSCTPRHAVKLPMFAVVAAQATQDPSPFAPSGHVCRMRQCWPPR